MDALDKSRYNTANFLLAESAMERAQAYIEAGADGVMIHSKAKDPSEIISFCKSYAHFLPSLESVPNHISLKNKKWFISKTIT